VSITTGNSTTSGNSGNLILNTGTVVSGTAGSILLRTATVTRMTIDGTGIIFMTNATTSTSNTTGALTLSGGIGISNIADATSLTSGGTFTTAGGASIAKKLYVGTSIETPGFILTGKTSYTQITSSVTSVAITTNSGSITTFNMTTTTGSSTTFAVTSSLISTTSSLLISLSNYSGTPITNGIPILTVSGYGVGTVNIVVTNYGANSLNGTLNFTYILF
jgi:hypothetical protein